MSESTKTVNPIPPDFGAVTPYLAINDVDQAIEFYCQVFGAKKWLRLPAPDGSVAHAEVKIGQGIVMLAPEDPRYNASPKTLGKTTVILAVYVDDVDAVVAKAVAAGSKIIFPVKDQFYGDRSGRIEDPFGYHWMVATHKEDVDPQEMERRLAALMKQSS